MENLFDLKSVPFSYHGSWMAVSIPRGEERLFVRNFHGGPKNVFPLQVLAEDRAVAPAMTVQPWVLELVHGEGRIEICFERTGTIRMRGRGVGLQLGDRHLIYSEAPNRAVINCRSATRRYQLEVLHGRIDLQQLVSTQPVFPRIAIVSPAEDGTWELAIDEFWSTWVPSERKPFDECLADARRGFVVFRDSMPASRRQDERTRTLAAYVNWSCTVEPCGLIKRPTLFMSKNWMCNVWSWDQCFNAMALAAGQPGLAIDQMLTLVDHQDEFGSYPDSVNDVVIHYNFSKPPVHGWAWREILTRLPAPPSDEVAGRMYTSLSAQVEWWLRYRRMRADDGWKGATTLPYYLHGNDSGWDNSTMFGQGVPLAAPDLAALLVTQMDVLAGLAREMGKGEDADAWRQRADDLYAALMRELWQGDHFVARLANDGTVVESQSLIPWLPSILGERLPEDVRDCLRRGIAAHLTDWGLATEKIDSPRYEDDGYWQGPIWGPSTYLAVTGLDRCGFTELAHEVSEKFCRLCGKSGFAENFNARTGEPLCDKAYTWTASAFLLLAERMKCGTKE